MEQKDQWFVIYTLSRHEKILAEQLSDAGYTVYLPLVKKVRHWTDRKKTIEVPLFNSYIFIKGVNQKAEFKDYRSFVSFLMYDKKPAVVRQHEIDTLRSIIEHGYDLSDAGVEGDLKTGVKVLVTGGPLKGMEGELLTAGEADWFIIGFEDLKNSLKVNVPKKLLKKI